VAAYARSHSSREPGWTAVSGVIAGILWRQIVGLPRIVANLVA
jgi:hypothetical protein